MTPARLAAARALLAIASGRVMLPQAVDAERGLLTDSRDRAFLLELVAGVERWRNALDAVIAQASGRPVAQIDERALTVLRMAVHQIRHLDRVPVHAAVSESVDLVGALGAPRGRGFVNAVLRRLVRDRRLLQLPTRPPSDAPRETLLRYLTVAQSHPAWLAERWLDRIGFEAADAWCTWNNRPPALTIWSPEGLLPDQLVERLAASDVAADRSRWSPNGVVLTAGGLGRLTAEFRQTIRVQDEGAQLVAHAAEVRPGERVLDLCAAPGGKSLVMATALAHDQRPGQLVAADFRSARVALLADAVACAPIPVPVLRLDARAPLPFGPVFDCVLVDVPCSGLGTLRRDPDLKWSRHAADLPRLAANAATILRRAAEAVRPGGRLVYATCSSEPEENADVVSAFLDADSRFASRPVGRSIPGALVNPDGHLETRPDRHALDGFYAAVLVRQQGA